MWQVLKVLSPSLQIQVRAKHKSVSKRTAYYDLRETLTEFKIAAAAETTELHCVCVCLCVCVCAIQQQLFLRSRDSPASLQIALSSLLIIDFVIHGWSRALLIVT